MSEVKDPAIKLFGKTIPLPEIAAASSTGGFGAAADDDCGNTDLEQQDQGHGEESKSSGGGGGDGEGGEERECGKDAKDERIPECKKEKKEDGEETANVEVTTSGLSEKSEISTPEKDSSNSKRKAAKPEEEQNETSASQETKLKKPDKILPCPRCNSMDTKFCYYNNYNVNQPRHFCKNCQRYWTAGGTMRNVPVGAGRRKNKNSSASHYRHITMSAAEALQNPRTDLPNGVHPQTNGTVLTFGSDAMLCESMASALNLADKAMRNGFHKPEELKIQIPYGVVTNGDDASNRSPNPSKDESGTSGSLPNSQGFPPKVPCFPAAPWPYPWNSAHWIPPAPPGFHMPFYPPAAYWSCPVPPTGAWSFPWIPQPSSPSSSGPNSPTLGKHSRDENMAEPGNSKEDEPLQEKSNPEKSLWVPKTLRIDDPGQAAKSSIWETLGIKAFGSKDEEKRNIAETPPRALHANPAALSRSAKFQESS